MSTRRTFSARIRLGCRTMCSVFNAGDHDVPFFSSQVRPQAFLRFHSHFSEAHVPGRHLNALLNAEDAAGIRIDEACIEKHAAPRSCPIPAACRCRSTGRTLDEPTCPWTSRPHDIRGIPCPLCAGPLPRVGGSPPVGGGEHRGPHLRAVAAGDRVGQRPARAEIRRQAARILSFVEGLARAAGPLVKYYRATGYGPALRLALVLKEKLLQEFSGGRPLRPDALRESHPLDHVRYVFPGAVGGPHARCAPDGGGERTCTTAACGRCATSWAG